MQYKIKGEYIELMQLLKTAQFVSTGGQAGILIMQGSIKLNGETELRKRAKIRVGDVVEYGERKIEII